jgi:hypothetical protein
MMRSFRLPTLAQWRARRKRRVADANDLHHCGIVLIVPAPLAIIRGEGAG